MIAEYPPFFVIVPSLEVKNKEPALQAGLAIDSPGRALITCVERPRQECGFLAVVSSLRNDET